MVKKRADYRGYLEGFSVLVFVLIVLGFTFVTSAITLTFIDVSVNGTLTNVTAEGNFTHLSLNDSSLFLYFPFDINHTVPSNITYDYSSNHFDGVAQSYGGSVFGALLWNSTSIFSGGSYRFWVKSVNSGNVQNNVNVTGLLANDTHFDGNLTISLWALYSSPVTAGTTSQDSLIGFGTFNDATVNATWCMRLSNSGALTFQYKNATTQSGTISNSLYTIATNVSFMYTIAISRSSNTIAHYVNGSLARSETLGAGDISNNTRPLLVGSCYNAGGEWNGLIDDVMVFNRTLSSVEVGALYSNTTQRFLANGSQTFSNLNLLSNGEDFLNITLNQTLVTNASNFTIRIGNSSGGTYVYSNPYSVVNGSINQIPLGTPENQSIIILFNSDSNQFFTPTLQGLSLLSYRSTPLPPKLNISLSNPSDGEIITSPYVVANATLTNQSGLSSSYLTYGFFNANDSLLAWIPMDESNATVFFDKSGRGLQLINLTGTVKNTTSYAFGNASLQFSQASSSAYINSGLINSRFVQTRELTFSLWINPNVPVTTDTLLSCYSGNKGYAWYLLNGSTASIAYNNTLRLTLYNGTGATHAYSDHFQVNNGTWYQIATTFYRDTANFYVNGRKLMSSTYVPNFNLTDCGVGQTNIGGNPFGQIGKIDDILVFDRALTSEEIGYLYNVTGGANRSLSASLHGLTNGTISLQASGIDREGNIANSSSINFIARTSGPNFISANYSFESVQNITSLSAWVDRGFYPLASAYNFSQMNASAYYRANNGSWILISNNTYTSYNESLFGGAFGDSITGGGQTYRWPSYFDPAAHTYFITSPNITRGVGGTWCYQIRANILANATNGTTIFLQCGTNDMGNNVALETITGNYTAIFADARAKNLSIYLINMLPRHEARYVENTSALNSWLYNYYRNNNSDRLILGFADVYNSSLKNETNTANFSLFLDGIHPNDDGAALYADIIFRQAYRYKYHDGFYAEFTPAPGILNDTYDLKWNLTTSTGESSEYQWNNAFSLAGTYNVTPVVLLSSPNNGSSVSSALVSFAAEVSTNFTLMNATFYLWNSSGDLINATTNTTITGTDANLSLSVTLPYEGVFSWNYGVVNNYNYYSTNGTNWTLTYTIPAGSSSSSSGGSSSSSSSSGGGGGSFLPTPRANATVPAVQSDSSSSSSRGYTAPAPIEPETTSWLGSAFETLTNTLRSALSKTTKEILSSPRYKYIGGGLILAGAVAGVVMILRARVKKQYGYVPHSWWFWRK